MSGLMIAAPASGAGKTTVALALLRALARRGCRVASAKAGPDYIDPAFHAAAGGGACVNLDPWAMAPARLRDLAARQTEHAECFVVEAMMGLFDGAADGTDTPADLAATLGLNVVLVVDCAKQSHSVAALVRGFDGHRSDTRLAGLVLNRVGSDRHATLLREAMMPLGIPVLGVLRRDAALILPERHLGLVQAGEHGDLGAFVDRAADRIEAACDLDALAALARPDVASRPDAAATAGLPPLGQRVAVARDAAFAFAYPHMLADWHRAGAEIRPFSPLVDEAPDASADAVFLPGGYPELHAGRLTANTCFLDGLRAAAERGARVYGECGGYMVLGERLIDADGVSHAMAGLLGLTTSFAERRLHLGYRRLISLTSTPLPRECSAMAHEFHYATIVEERGAPLFGARDARGADLGRIGLVEGSVCGSFAHVIDVA